MAQGEGSLSLEGEMMEKEGNETGDGAGEGAGPVAST